MKRLRTLAVALAFALAATISVGARPASAFVHSISLHYNQNGSTSSYWVAGVNSDWSDLSLLTTGANPNCDGWNDCAASTKVSVLATQCVVYYTGTAYSGSTYTVLGPRTGDVFNFPTGIKYAVSSFRFGTLSGSSCVAPWG